MSVKNDLLVLWVDLEVSDFDPTKGGITQCSIIIEHQNKVLDQVDLYINPNTYKGGSLITPYNLERSHLTTEQIEKYPHQKEAFEKFLSSIDHYGSRLILAGQNVIKHDLRFLEMWFIENDKNIFDYISYNPIDTLALATIARDWGYLEECESNSLEGLCKFFDVKQTKWHVAKDDVRAVREMYGKFSDYIQRGGVK